MKLMIASDIHGSAYYCERLLDAFSAEGADRLLLLGDILYHGPRNDLPRDYAPKRVIEMLNGISDKIICVRGNCDADVDRLVLDFPITAESCILWLNGRMIFATHGDSFNAENPPKLHSGDILLHGHTHISVCEKHSGGFSVINPGSVSLPKNGTLHGYIVLNDGGFVWHNLEKPVGENEYMSMNI